MFLKVLWMALIADLIDNDEKLASSDLKKHWTYLIQDWNANPYPVWEQNVQKSILYFCLLKNHTLWGWTYLYNGVPLSSWAESKGIENLN